MDEKFLDYLRKVIVPTRVERDITAKVIVPDLPENEYYINLDNKELKRHLSVIPAKMLTLSMEVMIYGP